MAQDEMRRKINLKKAAGKEGRSKVRHCLQYFTDGYNNAWSRADLKTCRVL